MSSFWIIWTILSTVIVILAVRHMLRNHNRPTQNRGVKPGQGDTVIDNRGDMFGRGGGHPTVTRVTRDPQQYAKGFVPSNARKSK